jgi:hypothetical protein
VSLASNPQFAHAAGHANRRATSKWVCPLFLRLVAASPRRSKQRLGHPPLMSDDMTPSSTFRELAAHLHIPVLNTRQYHLIDEMFSSLSGEFTLDAVVNVIKNDTFFRDDEFVAGGTPRAKILANLVISLLCRVGMARDDGVGVFRLTCGDDDSR